MIHWLTLCGQSGSQTFTTSWWYRHFLQSHFLILLQRCLWENVRETLYPILQTQIQIFRCLALLLGKKIGTEIPILRAVFMDYLKQPCFPSQRVIYNLNGLTVEWTKYILRHQEKKVNKTEARYSFSIARNSIYFNVLIL